ncbi:rRNA pseudouridine synthase [candidate division NPL-UPA2 bacterium]|nr:rRNA pseudouridine synthase [candidate division NPL-UPA2 bacterium]
MAKEKSIRLQVFLSHSGVSSRRWAGEWIKAGRCSVNGKRIFEPSYPVDPGRDKVLLDGERIAVRKKIYVLLNKPRGVVTTRRDRFAEKTVLDILPEGFGHLYPVGRLDKDTTGLLLLTNDGELTYRLTHPRFEIDKLYGAVLDKPLRQSDLKLLEKGIPIEGVLTAPCKICCRDGLAIEITLHEGRKRQIKRMFSVLGYKVVELTRLKEAHLTLDELPPGRWRFLSRAEIETLYHSVKLKFPSDKFPSTSL